MTQKIRKAVLPVAGLGTRFLPATKAMPKEMLTVVDKPVIQYAVEEAVAAGIEDIIFITGRGKSAIENHFDRPYELIDQLERRGKTDELARVQHIVPQNVRLSYTRQGSPLGLGHAVGCARSMIGDEPFAVLLPDDIIFSDHGVPLADMVALYEQTGRPVVMCEDVPAERTRNYGMLKLADGAAVGADGGPLEVRGFVEKPEPEDAPSRLGIVGRYIFTPEIFDHIAAHTPGAGGEIQLTDAMDKMCATAPFSALKLHGRRFDCGDKVGFQMANLFFALRDPYISPRLGAFLDDMMTTTTTGVKTA